jgi:hypothetical protein
VGAVRASADAGGVRDTLVSARPYSLPERIWLGAAMFLLCVVALVLPAMRLGAPAFVIAAALAAAAFSGAAVWRSLPARPAKAGSDALERLIIAGAIVYFAVLCHGGAVLPAGDAVAVPQLAAAIAAGRLPVAAYPPGSSAHAYPPGYPLLFAPASALLSPVAALGLFKGLNILTAALIPAAWAWLQIRLFRPRLPAWAVLACSYFAFFAVERTLGFFLSVGGKNAAFLGILLTPFAVVLTIRLARSWRGVVPATLVVFGLMLVHYSMWHLMAALLAAYAGWGLIGRRLTVGEVVRLAMAGAGAAALIWLFMSEAASDPRAAALTFDPLAMKVGLGLALKSLVASVSPIVIFMDFDFHLLGSPYRGLLLIACTAVSLAIAARLRDADLRDGALTWFTTFVIGLLCGYGAIPAGITLDFVRSYLWAVQAAVIASAAGAVLMLLSSRPAREHRLGYAAAAVVVLSCGTVMLMDARVETYSARQHAIPNRDLERIAAVLDSADRSGACHLIGESNPIPGAPVVVQGVEAWNYAEIVSKCRFLNGSWVHPGVSGGRRLGGYPSTEVMRAVAPADGLVFVGRAAAHEAYVARLRSEGQATEWTPLGHVAGAQVWRLTPSPRRISSLAD